MNDDPMTSGMIGDVSFSTGTSNVPGTNTASANGAGDSLDINQLDLEVEALSPSDEKKLADALEFSPTLTPGKFHTFIFALEKEKPLDKRTMKDKPVAVFRYTAREVKAEGEGRLVRFCEANTFKSGNMVASRIEELLFALGKFAAFNQSQRRPSDILRLLQEAEGSQQTFEGLVQWRHYDSSSGITTSTNPAKPYKRTVDGVETTVVEQAWPRNPDGSFARHPGNEVVQRVRPVEAKSQVKANSHDVHTVTSIPGVRY